MIDNENQSSTGKNLKYYRLGFMPLLEELSDTGFRNVKAKFIAEKDRVVNYHKERSVSELLNLMCESGMLIEFNRISFAKVLNSLSPIGAFWTRPIVSYVDDLVTLINKERISQFGVKEAEEALGYLSEMVNMCKNCIGEKNQSESIQYLVDIYKTVSCLNQVSRDSEYKFQVNRSNLNDTESK